MSTIVAIATAPGIGGIGIIRMSGEKTFEIIQKIFLPKKPQKIEEIKGYQMKYGNIWDPRKNEIIDEVLVSFFKNPNSYTTENMCEINSHGGIIIMRRILELCIEMGANLAEPGEFTKRAFLNGRMDLSQAESVIDMIHAKSQKEAIASANQLKGQLSQKIEEIRQDILSVMVNIEVSIDYPEYDVEEVQLDKTLEILDKIEEKLQKLENSFETGKMIKDGIKVAIIGKPNAGKSSLLNAILQEERAIVTEIEGTTRDTIEEFITISGIPLKIIDTAGIRKAKDTVEQIGIEKSKKTAQDADLIIAVLDASCNLTKEDSEILEFVKNRKSILVLNKMDKQQKIKKEDTILQELGKEIIEISAIQDKGIEKLYDTIAKMFSLNQIQLDSQVTVTNLRHQNLIRKAKENLGKAKQSLKQNMPIDLVAIDIKNILENLGEITGENVSEDILKEIFSKFCLGK